MGLRSSPVHPAQVMRHQKRRVRADARCVLRARRSLLEAETRVIRACGSPVDGSTSWS